MLRRLLAPCRRRPRAGPAVAARICSTVCCLCVLTGCVPPLFPYLSGDRALGLQSLPVAFGVDTAKWICVASIDATQLGVAAYLAFGLDEPIYGAVLLGLILPQARVLCLCLSFCFEWCVCWSGRASEWLCRWPDRAAGKRPVRSLANTNIWPQHSLPSNAPSLTILGPNPRSACRSTPRSSTSCLTPWPTTSSTRPPRR